MITFDAHPDEILLGSGAAAPDGPGGAARAARGAGVEVTVVQHFDDALRMTPYDAFVRGITERTRPRRVPDDPRRRVRPRARRNARDAAPSSAAARASRSSSCRRSRSTGARSARRTSGPRSRPATWPRPRPAARPAVRRVGGRRRRRTAPCAFAMPVALPPGAAPTRRPPGTGRRSAGRTRASSSSGRPRPRAPGCVEFAGRLDAHGSAAAFARRRARCYHPPVIEGQIRQQFVFGGPSAARAGREAGDHHRVCHQGR